MAEGVNVRFAGELQRFIKTKVEGCGLYGSASEYIRDLVRRDYQRDEELKWAALRRTLKAGLEADKGNFVTLDAGKLIAEARSRKRKHAR
jgi:antitoxin ParD1/3/4